MSLLTCLGLGFRVRVRAIGSELGLALGSGLGCASLAYRSLHVAGARVDCLVHPLQELVGTQVTEVTRATCLGPVVRVGVRASLGTRSGLGPGSGPGSGPGLGQGLGPGLRLGSGFGLGFGLATGSGAAEKACVEHNILREVGSGIKLRAVRRGTCVRTESERGARV